MQVSNDQIQKILAHRGDNPAVAPNSASSSASSNDPSIDVAENQIAEQVATYMAGIDEPEFTTPPEMVQLLVAKVTSMPDREDRVAELKARYEAGDYNPTSAEIADAMIRRSIADSIR